MASSHSKIAVYEVTNCRTIVRVHLGTYIENVNVAMYFCHLSDIRMADALVCVQFPSVAKELSH